MLRGLRASIALRKRFDFVGFGALNVDKLYKVNEIAHEDEESFILSLEEACGGSAANTIVGLARLGFRTGFIGKVARDREGTLLLRDFEREGVDVSGIIISKEGSSGIVLGFVDRRGERALYVNPGVNDTISFDEIDVEYARSSKVLHLTSFVGDKSFEAQRKLVEVISNEVIVSFDPGSLYARKGLEALRPILRKASIVLLSEAELKSLTEGGLDEGSMALIDEGARIIAVKLGERGCYVTNGEEAYLVEPYRVEVVDTTGAGDAFNAGFLCGFINGMGLYECGRLGNFVASRCITKVGARAGLPRISDVRMEWPSLGVS